MTNSTLNTASFLLAPTAGGSAVASVISVSGDTATLVPASNLAASTQYTATITTAATSAGGTALATNYTWSFTTGVAPDTTPPVVSATSPSNAANGVATNASVSATFSKAMTNSTLTPASFTLAPTTGGGAVVGTVRVSGDTATFTPTAALAASTSYTATIASSVTDASGNALGANFTWSFTTAAAPDTTPPTVTSTSPVSGAAGVALNAAVSATFSKAMTNATLTTASVLLATSGGTAVAGTVNVNANTVTFTPSAALSGSTPYTATITTAAKDASGNALAANYTWSFTTGAAPDTTPPPTPTGLTATAVSSSQINLSWTASTDNVAVTGYRVYRGGTLFITLGNVTTYQNTGLTASTPYSYTVVALDAAGNASGQSTSASATTLATPDTTPPSTPTGLTASAVSTSQINLSWTASTDNVGVTGYRIYRGGTLLVTVGTVTTYQDTGITASTAYSYTVVAIDAAGNASGQSAAASATTSATSNGTAVLTWTAVTDANLSGYRVYYGTASGTYLQPYGQGISVGNVTTYTVTGLSSGTTYYFVVTSVDTSGNESGYSQEVSKTFP
jgi:chitodextrinase